jgi:UPF0271 protein
MGESYGVYTMGMDDAIMPYIDMVNLACGFHAGDPLTMHASIKLAKKHKVEIGAHPAYPDLVGFGRREMKCSTEEIVAMVLYQCGALDGISKSEGVKVSYLKPHGALYNTMMKDMEVFKAICKAVLMYEADIKLMILSTSKNHIFKEIAQRYKVSLLYEVFADRAYTDEGYLLQRSEKNAVFTKKEEILQRATLLQEKGCIKTITGRYIELEADTLCMHSDTPNALELIKFLHTLLHTS